MTRESEYKIFETTDYEKFTLLEGNREIGSLLELEESFDNIGYLPIPGVVNEKNEIIEGQHRFELAKKKGFPFKYVIVKGTNAETCPYLNRGQKNWKSSNYVHLYARLGDPDYICLEKLMEKFKGVYSLEDILCFVLPAGVSGGAPHKLIRERALELSEERAPIIEARLKTARSLGFVDIQKSRGLSKRAWWGAVSYAFKHNDISIKELASRLAKSPLELVSYTKVEDMLRCFDEINNKGRRNLVFMSTDYLMGKYKDI